MNQPSADSSHTSWKYKLMEEIMMIMMTMIHQKHQDEIQRNWTNIISENWFRDHLPLTLSFSCVQLSSLFLTPLQHNVSGYRQQHLEEAIVKVTSRMETRCSSQQLMYYWYSSLPHIYSYSSPKPSHDDSGYFDSFLPFSSILSKEWRISWAWFSLSLSLYDSHTRRI